MNFSSTQKPYIGVTDFVTRSQVEQAKKCIQPDSFHRLHVGAMMSYKTFHGIQTTDGWEKVWLSPKELQKLFVPDDEVFNVLHWADFAPCAKTTSKDLIAACKSCGPGLTGLQLDMVWPDTEMIMEVKNSLPDLSIILQVSKIAIQAVRALDFRLDHKLCSYKGHVEYILLDYGVGRGTPFIPSEMLEFVSIARTCFLETSIAVAGGLGPSTLYMLDPLLAKYPRISWDAQGRLRKSMNALDPLEIEIVKKYLRKSSQLASMYYRRQFPA